jgi:hypothetical protein
VRVFFYRRKLLSGTSPVYATPPGFPTAFSVQLSNTATPVMVNGYSLSAIATTTSPIGGGALTSGACTTGTSTIPFGTLSSTTVFMTTPQKYPGSSVVWDSYALNSTQVVTEVCALLNVTPVSTSYNVLFRRYFLRPPTGGLSFWYNFMCDVFDPHKENTACEERKERHHSYQRRNPTLGARDRDSA